jgi:hypothetical protein
MPKNEDGEFELIVGNKQLLSIVFILMVLFGVVFSMGYFLGRANAGGDVASAATPAGAAAQSTQGRPDAAGPQTHKADPAAADPGLQPGDAKVATPEAGSGTSPVTSPAASAPAESPAPEPAPAPAPPPRQQPKPVPVAPKHVEPPASPAAAAADGQPVPGHTYLQVTALKKPQAQLFVELLKERGFHAIMSPIEGQDVFRILVGPVDNAAELAKTKTSVEGLGIGIKPIVRKY